MDVNNPYREMRKNALKRQTCLVGLDAAASMKFG